MTVTGRRTFVGAAITTALALLSPLAAMSARAVGVSTSPANATEGCSLTSTGGAITRTVNGKSYILNVPAGLTGPAVPLLISLHGGMQPVSIHQSETGWEAFAAANNFIVAFPVATGSPLSWDFAHGSADVAFVRDVVADISATWCIDSHRVYAEGYSNGAMLAEQLACDAADVFASVTAYAGASPSILGSPCTPSRPISIGIFQSALDPASSLPIGILNRSEWLDRNECPDDGLDEIIGLLTEVRTHPCAAATEVYWRLYLLNSHNWPLLAQDKTDILAKMWALFQRNPLP